MSAPKKGDLIYINFSPQAGHEQAGRRPAIVVSPENFNQVTGFVAVCPITNTTRGWGYELPIPSGLAFSGVILTDQVKTFDWRARRTEIKGEATEVLLKDCIKMIHTYIS